MRDGPQLEDGPVGGVLHSLKQTEYTPWGLPPLCSNLKSCASERLQSRSSWEVAVLNGVSLPKAPPAPSLSLFEFCFTPPPNFLWSSHQVKDHG